MNPVVESKREEVAALCLRLGVRRLQLFGSAARDDFDDSRSDIDLLVEFKDDPALRTWSHYFDLKQSLEQVFARPVDLVEQGSVLNPFVKASIERDRRPIYES
jgi:predicted nucleotidyltransferase